MGKHPNWLFRVLFVVSVGFHTILFMHMAGIYRSKALSFIELTLEDVSRSEVRNIPRPRMRPKKSPEPASFSRPRIDMQQLPAMKPLKLDPAEADLPDQLVEKINTASIPAAPAAAVADWRSFKPQITAGDDSDTAGAYLEMVRFRIERHKHYPVAARTARMEGRVTVRFVITKDGKAESVSIAKSSRKKILDEAALEAVRRAAPFPIPPERFFKGNIPLELDIVFELT